MIDTLGQFEKLKYYDIITAVENCTFKFYVDLNFFFKCLF